MELGSVADCLWFSHVYIEISTAILSHGTMFQIVICMAFHQPVCI